MDKENIAVQQKRRWVGLDWGGAAHAVCFIDEDRALVTQFAVAANLEGLEELAARLGAPGCNGAGPLALWHSVRERGR